MYGRCGTGNRTDPLSSVISQLSSIFSSSALIDELAIRVKLENSKKDLEEAKNRKSKLESSLSKQHEDKKTYLTTIERSTQRLKLTIPELHRLCRQYLNHLKDSKKKSHQVSQNIMVVEGELKSLQEKLITLQNKLSQLSQEGCVITVILGEDTDDAQQQLDKLAVLNKIGELRREIKRDYDLVIDRAEAILVCDSILEKCTQYSRENDVKIKKAEGEIAQYGQEINQIRAALPECADQGGADLIPRYELDVTKPAPSA